MTRLEWIVSDEGIQLNPLHVDLASRRRAWNVTYSCTPAKEDHPLVASYKTCYTYQETRTGSNYDCLVSDET